MAARAFATRLNGAPFPSGFQGFDPHPRLSKKALKGQRLRLTSARCVNALNPAHLFVIRAQHLADLRVHQMRLGARKAGHLCEVVIIRIISSPSLTLLPRYHPTCAFLTNCMLRFTLGSQDA